jgi:hypothetical protein
MRAAAVDSGHHISSALHCWQLHLLKIALVQRKDFPFHSMQSLEWLSENFPVQDYFNFFLLSNRLNFCSIYK